MWLFHRRHRDLDREIDAHLELEAEESGLPADEARDAARRAFGNPTRVKESTRETWRGNALEQLAQDIRFAVRTLRRSPGFTAVAVLSLALGIGANTTIFTFLDAVLLRPLPYRDPDRIVTLRERETLKPGTVAVHPFNFLEWRARAHSFEALALTQMIPVNAIGPDGAEQVPALQTTSGLFQVFAAPLLGRGFTWQETLAGSSPIVILSHAYWQRSLASDPAVIGKTLALGRTNYAIIGVMPPGVRIGSMTPDLYLPLGIDPAKPESVGSRSFAAYGRLRAGVSLESAQAEIGLIAAGLARQFRLDEGYTAVLSRLHDDLVHDSRPMLMLLMGAVALVLLIACVNLAGLLLTRGIGRRNELAIRASLGAGRARLIRQLVAESLLLSGLGGAVGLLLGYWGMRALDALSRTTLTAGTVERIDPDWRVFAFTIALSGLTALLFGLLPAWQVSRLDLQTALRERGRGSSGDRRHGRLRAVLVIGEIALATILLVGAGLLLRTFASLLAVDPGFHPEQTLTLRLFLGGRDASQRAGFIEQVLEKVQALPEVAAAGTIQFLPVAGISSGTSFRFDDEAPRDLPTEGSLIGGGYFAAMGIPILQGRAFDRRDRAGSPRVVIVNQAFVRKYIADGHPLGRRITVAWSNQASTEIIGVVGDVRQNGLMIDPHATVFLPHPQTPGYITHLVIRTTGNTATLAAAVRRAVQQIDPLQTVSAAKTMEQYISESIARPRLYAALLGAFAGLALLLAAIGLYGLIAYAVGQRTHEIGIRLALGAQRGAVLRMVLVQGVALSGAGLALGICGALALARLVSSVLFRVTTTDLATYGAVAVALGIVSLVAAIVPARRAAGLDPVIALRCE